MPGEVIRLDKPVLVHLLNIIRDKDTPCEEVRQKLQALGFLMGRNIINTFEKARKVIVTPKGTITSFDISESVCAVCILRASIPMEQGVFKCCVSMGISYKTAHFGVYRDESTKKPVIYYEKFPTDLAERHVLIIDPMLATGGTAIATANRVKELISEAKRKVPTKIDFLCLVAAPEGVKAFHDAHPDIDLWIVAVDERLDDDAYIVPGLGDAGCRAFGTEILPKKKIIGQLGQSARTE